ncbi:hypothetical protein HZH66_008632 [Vespula vulgaris]|uniref:Uncharacterized protein n=1 Tax=Vespula vulgaris TaxID=7454 RepID=A0A834JQP7_VESVU|nr:hypothetical protein HZH66_008632 [Vespula vulgaris]
MPNSLAVYFNLESDKERIELLFYTMGSIAKELMTELKPNFEKEMSYEEVKTEFTKYLTVKKHVIIERQKFNNRVKLPNETIDAFTTDLLKLESISKEKEEKIQEDSISIESRLTKN